MLPAPYRPEWQKVADDCLLKGGIGVSAIADSDDELIQMVRSAGEGDLRPFELLVRRHQSRVVANCRHMVRDSGYAEDLAQEVFVKVFFSLGRFEGRSSFKTWLQRIKVNHCLNHLKAQQGKIFVDVEDESLTSSQKFAVPATAEKEVMAQADRDRIREVLDSMPDTLRLPLVLRDMDQLSYEEVAQLLGIGLSAVKMRIKRAREEFRRLISHEHQAA